MPVTTLKPDKSLTEFVVAESDPAKAEHIIKAVMAPNKEVNAVGPVSADQVKAFGMKSGDYIHSRPQP